MKTDTIQVSVETIEGVLKLSELPVSEHNIKQVEKFLNNEANLYSLINNESTPHKLVLQGFSRNEFVQNLYKVVSKKLNIDISETTFNDEAEPEIYFPLYGYIDLPRIKDIVYHALRHYKGAFTVTTKTFASDAQECRVQLHIEYFPSVDEIEDFCYKLSVVAGEIVKLEDTFKKLLTK